METGREFSPQYTPEAGDISHLLQKFEKIKTKVDQTADKTARAELLETMKQIFQTATANANPTEATSAAFKAMQNTIRAYEAAAENE
ncbi:MAG: hypothetical protein Q8M83_03225 [bacterium]|nr:hypothetical protein [bacterium]